MRDRSGPDSDRKAAPGSREGTEPQGSDEGLRDDLLSGAADAIELIETEAANGDSLSVEV